MRKFLFIVLLFFSFNTKADYNEIAEVLKYVETLNSPCAIGDGGDSWGVLQIQEICVNDVNRYFGTHYTHKDMFQPECALEVFNLYTIMGVERYKRIHGVKPSTEVIVRNWNGGIYRGYKIKATISYYRKYLKWKKKLKKEGKI